MRLQAPDGSAFLTVDSPEDESDTQADMGIHIDLISDEEDASRALVELNQNRSDAPQQVGATRIRTVLHLRTSESMRGLWLEHASVRRSAHRPHGVAKPILRPCAGHAMPYEQAALLRSTPRTHRPPVKHWWGRVRLPSVRGSRPDRGGSDQGVRTQGPASRQRRARRGDMMGVDVKAQARFVRDPDLETTEVIGIDLRRDLTQFSRSDVIEQSPSKTGQIEVASHQR